MQEWTPNEVTRLIAERFIQETKGMTVRRAEIGVSGNTQVLVKLEKEWIVQRFGPEYFPRYRALNYLDSQLRGYSERCTEMVLKALKWLYKTDDTNQSFSFLMVRSAAKSTIDRTAEDEMIRLGMLLACGFPHLITGWSGSPRDEGFSLSPRPEILRFKNIQSAWDAEVATTESQQELLLSGHRSKTVDRGNTSSGTTWTQDFAFVRPVEFQGLRTASESCSRAGVPRCSIAA